jgi:hypothetical protein
MKNTLLLAIAGVAALLSLALVMPVAAGGNLGTVSAGSISGVTAVFGAGAVVLNSTGISVASGSNFENSYRFDAADAGLFWAGGSSFLGLRGPSGVRLEDGGNGILNASDSGIVLPQETGGGTRFVCIDNNGLLFMSGGTCDGSAPAPLANATVVALEKEVADLRALVQQLASQQ